MTEHVADFHCHTYYSDGQQSPAALVDHASALGLKHLAITDHDTVRGALEALPLAQQMGIDLLPGVELTTCWQRENGPRSVDLLAYGMDWDEPVFIEMVDGALEDIKQRMATACRFMTGEGYSVTLDDLYAKNPRYAGVSQLLAALSPQSGLTIDPDVLAIFDAVWPRVPPPALRIEEAIQAVHAAGGVAVLAHPVRLRLDGGLIQPETLAPLVESGLDGLEVYHPSAGIPARGHYHTLADHFNLLMTGGSDEHAVGGSFDRLGRQPVTVEIVATLKNRIAEQHTRLTQQMEHHTSE